MKKIGLICAALLTCGSLAGCAKKINNVKAYSTEVSSKVTPASGSKDYQQGLMKIKGTSSAPDGYQVMAINSDGKNNLVSGNTSMAGHAVVENGKFTGYVDPLQANKNAKKGTKLKYHFIAVKDPDNLGQKDKAAFKQQVNKKFDATTIKLSFDPTTSYVQTNVQNALGKGAIVSKKSKTVYTITPKKDSAFEDKVSQSMYSDKDQWADITKQINLNNDILLYSIDLYKNVLNNEKTYDFSKDNIKIVDLLKWFDDLGISIVDIKMKYSEILEKIQCLTEDDIKRVSGIEIGGRDDVNK